MEWESEAPGVYSAEAEPVMAEEEPAMMAEEEPVMEQVQSSLAAEAPVFGEEAMVEEAAAQLGRLDVRPARARRSAACPLRCPCPESPLELLS